MNAARKMLIIRKHLSLLWFVISFSFELL